MAKPLLSDMLKVMSLGALSGVRTMAGPSLVLPAFFRPRRRSPFSRAPKIGNAEKILDALTLLEMAGDKLPQAPDRVSRNPLIGRAISGALTGGLAYRSLRRRDPGGIGLAVLCGGIAAVAGAYAAFHLRRFAGRGLHIPDFLLGLAEDALVVRAGRNLAGKSFG